jgi:hypothetical protein
MRKILAITAASVALTFATAASAQTPQLYVKDENGQRFVTDGDQDMPILPGGTTAGVAPADCPEGSYFESGDMIIACGDDGQRFSLMAPEPNAMQPDGQPYPQGAMLMTPVDPASQESGDSKQAEGAAQESPQ